MSITIGAVQSFGKDARRCRFPGPTGPGEEVGVGHMVLCYLPGEGRGDMGLAYDVFEGLRPVFPVESLIIH